MNNKFCSESKYDRCLTPALITHTTVIIRAPLIFTQSTRTQINKSLDL